LIVKGEKILAIGEVPYSLVWWSNGKTKDIYWT